MEIATACNHGPRRHSGCPDGCLLEAARGGDQDAYSQLFHRYYSRARAHACRLGLAVNDADEVVAQAFAATFLRVQRGGGPEGDFLPYLFVAVRNMMVALIRRRQARVTLVLVDDMERLAGADPVGDIGGTHDAGEHRALWSAFNSLSWRWRHVLWSTEVEGISARQLAPQVGMSPNAVAALSLRARRGLRAALAAT